MSGTRTEADYSIGATTVLRAHATLTATRKSWLRYLWFAGSVIVTIYGRLVEDARSALSIGPRSGAIDSDARRDLQIPKSQVK